MTFTKRELKRELNKLGVSVVANQVRKSDLKKLINAAWEDDEDTIVEDLLNEFVTTSMDQDDRDELREEIKQSLSFDDSQEYANLGKAGKFDADGEEYILIANEDEAEKIAEKLVKEDLQETPENFSKDFLKQHIYITDTDKRIIANEEADSRVEGMDDKDIIKEAEMQDEFDAAVDADDEKLQEKILQDAKDALQEKYYEEIKKELADPVSYFVDNLGAYTEDVLLKADFISIDYDTAAQEAVSIDGWAHFLSRYDGNYETTKGGLVYFKRG